LPLIIQRSRLAVWRAAATSWPWREGGVRRAGGVQGVCSECKGVELKIMLSFDKNRSGTIVAHVAPRVIDRACLTLDRSTPWQA
jgi:hypothetical protein